MRSTRRPRVCSGPMGCRLTGAPIFSGIAAWIFDVYLTCRSAGQDRDDAWAEVVASITQTEEWRAKHPGESPPARQGCKPTLKLNRTEFLQAMQRLDAFYQSVEGLQRPVGLSVDGVPDFLGIAAWVFDVYLNARLAGEPTEAAWAASSGPSKPPTSGEQKHPDGTPPTPLCGDRRLRHRRRHRSRRRDAGQELGRRLRHHHRRQQLHAGGRGDHRRQHRAVRFRLHLSLHRTASDPPPRETGSSRRSAITIGKRPAPRPTSPTSRCRATNATTTSSRRPCTSLPSTATPTSPTASRPVQCRRCGCKTSWRRRRSRIGSSTCITRRSRPARTDRTRPCSGRTPCGERRLCIAGHDHTYERIMRDGLPYFVNGAGGYALYTFLTPVTGSAIRYNARLRRDAGGSRSARERCSGSSPARERPSILTASRQSRDGSRARRP